MNEQKTLLSRIAICDFILTETALFLDTHPDCAEALAFYGKHLEMKKKAEEEYTRKYGMLKHSDYKDQNTWQWVEGPWPWEYEEV